MAIRTTSARVAVALATANGARVPEWCADIVDSGGSRGNIGSILHGLDCGRVLAAMDRCPEEVRCWLLLAYGADGYAPSRALHLVTSALYGQLARERTIKTTPARVANMAGAVVGDLTRQYRNPDRPGASDGDYARAIGVPTNQYKDVRPTVEAMQRIIDGWDRAGLGEVAASLCGEQTENAA